MTTLSFDLDERTRRVLAMTLPEALDHAAETWPDRTALVFIEDECPDLTWRELRDQVVRVRAGLSSAGVVRGDKVGVLLRNQVEFPVTWLAVAGLGAAIVPINPRYTPREVEFVLSDAGATWLVAAADILETYQADSAVGPVAFSNVFAVGGGVLGTLEFEDLLAADPDSFDHLAAKVDPDDVVNIQFTSGTTGLPKGCLLTHRYWVELGVYGALTFTEAQRTLADHPFYYMQNQGYLACAMTVGGALYVTRGLSRRKFLGWLVDHEIDMAWIDEGMLDFPPDDRDGKLAMKNAPVMALPTTLHAELEERFHLRARELYASTEIGNCTFAPWDRDDVVGTGSMGFCYPNRETKVVDEQLVEVAAGTPGELCVRGSGMMLGYHNRPEVNAELFLPGGWFRTGDVVRKDSDGQHYYVGRLRDMIRRSGENISSAEVEQHIAMMAGVNDVAVVPVPDPVRDEEVKAIVVLEPGAHVTADEVVAWARTGLAAFKVPRYVEFRSSLPYTGSGKVAKGELKKEEPLTDAVLDMLGVSSAVEAH